MKHRLLIARTAILLLVVFTAGLAQYPSAPRAPGQLGAEPFFRDGEREEPENTRSVEGLVLAPSGDPVEGAVVQMKDTNTLRIRSYITLEDGKYSFHGLSTETDYELHAKREKQTSRTRRLTVYDSRKKANIELKLEDPES
jgi:hypothetical protein